MVLGFRKKGKAQELLRVLMSENECARAFASELRGCTSVAAVPQQARPLCPLQRDRKCHLDTIRSVRSNALAPRPRGERLQSRAPWHRPGMRICRNWRVVRSNPSKPCMRVSLKMAPHVSSTPCVRFVKNILKATRANFGRSACQACARIARRTICIDHALESRQPSAT
eukprot:6205637-Pleurochrysis_carterae.AAC.2